MGNDLQSFGVKAKLISIGGLRVVFRRIGGGDSVEGENGCF
jgi:hypothetical protein